MHRPNVAQAPAQPFVTRNHPDTHGAFMYPTLPTTPGLKAFAEELDAERARQLAKFGDQRHPDGTGIGEAAEMAEAYQDLNALAPEPTWQPILLEEVYEALAESDPAKLRAELIQVAAVCAAWVSDLDRRPAAETACPSALVPLDSDPVERCIETGRHTLHRTASGETWTTSS